MTLVGAREQERRAALRDLNVMDTAPEQAFDDLALLARRLAGVPTAVISLVDADRQWFKARVGFEPVSTPRDLALCDHVIRGEAELVLEDARADPRFASNALVAGPPGIVFYAGFPLVMPGGLVVGTLCAIDYVPRTLDEDTLHGLRSLARQTSSQLLLRKLTAEQSDELVSQRAVEAELAGNAEFVRAVLDSVDVGIVACDAAAHLTLFNPAAREFHGVSGTSDVGSEEWPLHYDLFHPDGTTPLAPDDVPLLVALRRGAVEGFEMVIAPRGLPRRLVRCDGRALHTDGRTVGAVVVMSDITAAREAERSVRRAHEALTRSADALARSETQFRSAFENGPMAMLRLDADGVITHANPATRRLLSLTSSSLLGRRLPELASSADRDRLALTLARAGGARAVYTEVRMKLLGGAALWCEIAVSSGGGTEGAPDLLVQIADIEDRKRREVDLERRAARDDLTGLANRPELHRRLAELLDEDVAAVPSCVLFLDLNRFKEVNDSAGHSVGDEVLVEVAHRLRSLVRPEDLVARLGGDEFVLLRQDADGHVADRCSRLVDRVRETLARPFITSVGEHSIGVSIGSAIAQPGEDAGDVLARADAAMYSDKRSR